MLLRSDVYNKTSWNQYLFSGVVITRECPEMAANDVAREGLVTPIAFIGLRECATSLVTDIITRELDYMAAVVTELFEPVRAYVRPLTTIQVEYHQYIFFHILALFIKGKWLDECQNRNWTG